MRFRLFIAVFLYTCLAVQTHGKTFISEKHNFNTETLITGLDHPWGMSFLPNGNLLITQRSGHLLVADLSTKSVQKISGLPDIHEHGQGGLLDVLVHPDFESNALIYLSYVKNDGNKYSTEVVSAQLQNNLLSDLQTIFVALPKLTGTRHFGSRLVIDKDGYLFISLGDRGNRALAQKLDSHHGSVIRLHEDGSLPAENPFVGQDSGLPEIYSFGHRNIQGMAIHTGSQTLWTHEHGPQGGDELNRPQAGMNFGWPTITYGVNYGSGTKIGDGTHKTGMQQPVYYWVPSIAPSGMMFYESDKFPKWTNNLFVGSLKFSSLVRLEIESNQIVHEERLLEDELGRIRDIEQGPEGLIYILTDSANGKLVKLTVD